MRALIVTPAPRHARSGNRVTALRWASMLRALHHQVRIRERYEPSRDEPCDLAIALHAKKSAGSIRAFRARHPRSPLFVALTGTDVYHDLRISGEAMESLELASRIIVLQPKASDELPPHLRARARPVIQSARAPARADRLFPGRFVACVLANLRDVKDPLLAAAAARGLPESSKLIVMHMGGAIDASYEGRAREEERANARYRWLEVQPRRRALELLAGSDVLVLTSKLEGGANAVTEAIACGVPVISSRIAGSIGILGEDHPGYFPVGDAGALAELLVRAENDPRFLSDLRARSRALGPLVDPVRELETWRMLVDEGDA